MLSFLYHTICIFTFSIKIFRKWAHSCGGTAVLVGIYSSNASLQPIFFSGRLLWPYIFFLSTGLHVVAFQPITVVMTLFLNISTNDM